MPGPSFLRQQAYTDGVYNRRDHSGHYGEEPEGEPVAGNPRICSCTTTPLLQSLLPRNNVFCPFRSTDIKDWDRRGHKLPSSCQYTALGASRFHADLTLLRVYYPEGSKALQRVLWDDKIIPSSQSSMLRPLVEEILQQCAAPHRLNLTECEVGGGMYIRSWHNVRRQ